MEVLIFYVLIHLKFCTAACDELSVMEIKNSRKAYHSINIPTKQLVGFPAEGSSFSS